MSIEAKQKISCYKIKASNTAYFKWTEQIIHYSTSGLDNQVWWY